MPKRVGAIMFPDMKFSRICNLNKGSAEFQKAYVEAFFAAAEVLSAKEDIFKIDKKGILRNTNARFDLDRLVEKMLQEE